MSLSGSGVDGRLDGRVSVTFAIFGVMFIALQIVPAPEAAAFVFIVQCCSSNDVDATEWVGLHSNEKRILEMISHRRLIAAYLSGAMSLVVPPIGDDASIGKVELCTLGVDVMADTLIESAVVLAAPGDAIDRFDLSLASFGSFGSLGFFGPRRFGGGAFDAQP